LRQFLLTAAEELGAHHLKVTPDTSGAPWDAGRWAAEFALLATQAADAGARLGIEFLPWSNSRPPGKRCGWSKTPATPPAGSSSTSGTSHAPAHRRPSSPSSPGTGSSAWS
jgi:hypothetical protein